MRFSSLFFFVSLFSFSKNTFCSLDSSNNNDGHFSSPVRRPHPGLRRRAPLVGRGAGPGADPEALDHAREGGALGEKRKEEFFFPFPFFLSLSFCLTLSAPAPSLSLSSSQSLDQPLSPSQSEALQDLSAYSVALRARIRLGHGGGGSSGSSSGRGSYSSSSSSSAAGGGGAFGGSGTAGPALNVMLEAPDARSLRGLKAVSKRLSSGGGAAADEEGAAIDESGSSQGGGRHSSRRRPSLPPHARSWPLEGGSGSRPRSQRATTRASLSRKGVPLSTALRVMRSSLLQWPPMSPPAPGRTGSSTEWGCTRSGPLRKTKMEKKGEGG